MLKDAPITKPQAQPASKEAANKEAASNEAASNTDSSATAPQSKQDGNQAAQGEKTPDTSAQSPADERASTSALSADDTANPPRGQLHLTATPTAATPSEPAPDAAAEGTALSAEEHADQMTAAEDNALLNLGPVSEATSYTLELQTEYAISLDPNNQDRPDSTVSDLLNTPDGAAEAKPEAAAEATSAQP